MSSAPFYQQVHDQLNHRWEFDTVATYLRKAPSYQIVDDADVLNVTTKVMKLTRGKLIHQEDWNDWLQSEYLQLDQY
jgi:gluconate kinase